MNKAADRHAAKAYARMSSLLRLMRSISEQDMGWLKHKEAAKFHAATDLIHEIAIAQGIAE